MTRTADVTVVGGGPAGCATAIALCRTGLRVTLLDQGRPAGAGIGETLPAEAHAMLTRLGAWQWFPAGGRVRSGGTCSAWGGADLAWRDGFAQAAGAGWHVDRDALDPALRRAAACGGADVRGGVRVVYAGRRRRGGWLLSLRDGTGRSTRLATAFVVDASGRAAVVARHFGPRHSADRLTSSYARIGGCPDAAPLRHAIVESVPDGWWYAAGLPSGQRAVAFFSDADLVRRRRAACPGGWYALLRQTRFIFDALGRPGQPERVRCAPAASHCLLRVHGGDWAAAGDAVTAWDPLTAAGLTTALRSGVDLAAAVRAALAGNPGALDQYAARVHQLYTRYLIQRSSYYQIERRWPEAEFWRRRKAEN
jgi:flavin-dependent dehydrogenase